MNTTTDMTTNTDGAMPELPENIREGAPYDNARFEELCREHDIWGTAESAMCAVFWRTAIQQAAGCEHLRGDVGSRWCALAEKPEYPEQFPRRILDLIKEVARREDSGSYGAWQDENGEPMQDDADAALKWISGQQAAGSVPEGWKLVPVHPTVEMLDAADEGDRAYTLRNFGAGPVVMQGPEDHYAAMLAASPAPPKQQPIHFGGGEVGGVPLSDAAIYDLAEDFKSERRFGGETYDEFDHYEFARAIESAILKGTK